MINCQSQMIRIPKTCFSSLPDLPLVALNNFTVSILTLLTSIESESSVGAILIHVYYTPLENDFEGANA